jgi:hypothetical protein
MSLRVTSEFAGFFDQGSQGFASQRLKPRKAMSVDLYVEECTSGPQILHRELKVICECL